MGNSPQSYGAAPAMWDHRVTCYQIQMNVPHLNPSQTGWYLIYLSQRNGRLSWPWCWLYTVFRKKHPLTFSFYLCEKCSNFHRFSRNV